MKRLPRERNLQAGRRVETVDVLAGRRELRFVSVLGRGLGRAGLLRAATGCKK